MLPGVSEQVFYLLLCPGSFLSPSRLVRPCGGGERRSRWEGLAVESPRQDAGLLQHRRPGIPTPIPTPFHPCHSCWLQVPSPWLRPCP